MQTETVHDQTRLTVVLRADGSISGRSLQTLHKVVNVETGQTVSVIEGALVPLPLAGAELDAAVGEYAAAAARAEAIAHDARTAAEAERDAALQAKQSAESERDAATVQAGVHAIARGNAEAIADAAIAARIAAEGAAAEQRGRADILQTQLDAMQVQAPDFVSEREFMSRWPDDALPRFYAAKRQSPQLEAMAELVRGVGGVHVNSQRAINGRAALVAMGILSEAEAAAVFAMGGAQ